MKVFEKIIEKLKNLKTPCELGMIENGRYILRDNAIDIVKQSAAEYNNGWIPIKTRPMTEEEREYYSQYHFECNGMIFDCPLPDDSQEVLITSNGGYVEKTTFYTDYGCYFENYEDLNDVIAWKPLPSPYQPKEQNPCSNCSCDSEAGCTMPSTDRIYACPINAKGE